MEKNVDGVEKRGNCFNVKEREEGRGRAMMTRQTNTSDDRGRKLIILAIIFVG
jgi:hypothetical protein